MGHDMPHCTLEDAYKLFTLDQRARRLSPRTFEFYEWKLRQFFAWCNDNGVSHFSDLTATHIKTYLIYQGDRGMADYTIRGSAMAIRAFCKFVVREKLATVNPFDGVRMPKEPERVLPAFSKTDVQKLLKAAKNHRDRALIMLMLDTGMRAQEVINLNGGDINADNGEITVRRGKGNKGRIVYLGAKAQKQLLLYFIRRGTPDDNKPVFRGEHDGKTRLGRSRFFQLFRVLGKRAGVKPCTPHRFRRTFALEMARAGVNIHMIAKLMGHKDITVLKRYLDITQEDLRNAHRQASPTDNLL
jgi:site-specific recombinase XerD